MKVLCTGGGGFIGSHVCKALAKAGHTPIVYDNFMRGHRENVKWGPLVAADVTDFQSLLVAFHQYEPDAVIHLAGLAYVAESFESPSAYWQANVEGALNVLRAMHMVGLRKLVFSSSCAVYGETDVLPIVEAHPKRPISPYGRTKLAAEGMISDFAEAYKFRAIALRYFNAAGADPDMELREDHDPETHLIPLAIRAAKGGAHLIVNGNTHDTKDGTCIRDYIHVSDLAEAHVLALKCLEYNIYNYHAVNLGTGKGHSVIDVLSEVEKVSGNKVPGEIGSRRQGDPPELYCNADKARTLLQWKPKYTLKDIVEHAWRADA